MRARPRRYPRRRCAARPGPAGSCATRGSTIPRSPVSPWRARMQGRWSRSGNVSGSDQPRTPWCRNRQLGTHIDGQIHGAVAHGLPDPFDDAVRPYAQRWSVVSCCTTYGPSGGRRTDGVYLASLDALEAGRVVVRVVGRAGECRADGAVLWAKTSTRIWSSGWRLRRAGQMEQDTCN